MDQNDDTQKWIRQAQTIWGRLAGRIAQLGYGGDHVSKHRESANAQSNIARMKANRKARNRRRNKAARASRKHAPPRHTRRG